MLYMYYFIRLLVKILEKLTRAGFHVVGMRLVKQKNENEDERHSEDQDCVKTDWNFSNVLNGVRLIHNENFQDYYYNNV